jgi:predicted xylose isomerase-like sugar epimerase
MMTLRTLDGALKCALRDFLREEWMAGSMHPLAFKRCSFSKDV